MNTRLSVRGMKAVCTHSLGWKLNPSIYTIHIFQSSMNSTKSLYKNYTFLIMKTIVSILNIPQITLGSFNKQEEVFFGGKGQNIFIQQKYLFWGYSKWWLKEIYRETVMCMKKLVLVLKNKSAKRVCYNDPKSKRQFTEWKDSDSLVKKNVWTQ